jgi:hypothetical protein
MHVLPGVHQTFFVGSTNVIAAYEGTDGDPASSTATHTMSVSLSSATKSHRRIVVWVVGSNGGGANFTTLTVGGNSATQLCDLRNSEELGALYYYDDTTLSGATSIVSTMSDSAGSRAQCVVWTLESARPIVVIDSDTHATNSDFALSVSFVAGQAVIGGTEYVSGSAPTYTPTIGNVGYVSENTSGGVGGESNVYTGASTDAGTTWGAGTATIDTSGNGTNKVGCLFVFGN